MDEDVARYRRLLDFRADVTINLAESLCWTVIQPLTKPVSVAQVTRRLGGDPDEIEHQTVWADAPDSAVHLDQVGSAVVMVERFGYEGARPEVLRWLSDGTVVHNSIWGLSGLGRLSYAAFGQLLTCLESVDDDQPTGEQSAALDRDRAPFRGLDDDMLSFAAQLALIERRTGFGLDEAWLDEPHPMVELRRPIPLDPYPPGIFAGEDPDLATVLLMAGDPVHRAAVRWVLTLLADDSDLHGEAGVGAVLDALRDEWPAGEVGRGLRALWVRLQDEARGTSGTPEGDRLGRRMFAGGAFAETTQATYGPRGPRDTLYYAKRALGERWPEIRDELWRRARDGAPYP